MISSILKRRKKGRNHFDEVVRTVLITFGFYVVLRDITILQSKKLHTFK